VPRDPVRAARHAAAQLDAWLDARGPTANSAEPVPAGLAPSEFQESPHSRARGRVPGAAPHPERARTDRNAPAHTDWLYHHLTVSGTPDQVAVFRRAAAGAGVIPWHLDLDRLEEDWFHLLVAPPGGQARTLSLEGARLLAAALRAAVARRHALATALVGHSAACCFDLHALVPVPGEVLRLGPDHPDALFWLWTQWGTTQALRHVALRRGEGRAEAGALRVSFWSAEWTPWRALETIRKAWPGLRVAVRPIYELT
jgi:hypothetical protein